MEIIPGPEWQALLDVIVGSRGAVMIVGATDSGKSTLARYLVSQILKKDISVSLVDTDVGQTSLGLPGTISVKVFSSVKDLEDFLPDKMFFTGTVNPALRISLITSLAGKAVETSRRMSEIVLIDTSGLVSGRLGEVLKTGKVRAIRPEHIVAIQKKDEIEHVLKMVDDVRVFRVASSAMVKSRDVARRTRYRQEKYEEYFGDAGAEEFLVRAKDTEFYYDDRIFGQKSTVFPKGNVIGLNRGEETLALGLLTETTGDSITFSSPLGSLEGINRIVFGDIIFR